MSFAGPDHKTAWHALRADDVLERLDSKREGLSKAEATARLGRVGPNCLRRAPGPSVWQTLLGQFDNPLIWVLLVSGAVAIGLGKTTDGAVVLGVVVINAIIGFIQEYRAAKAIQSLSTMVPEHANAVRDGQSISVLAVDLVPGDIVMVAAGDRVPADLRVIDVHHARVDEAALTGESVPVDKQSADVDIDASLGDRQSMLFGGTMVTFGTAMGVTVATGSDTELGRISKLIEHATDLATPLTQALAAIAKRFTVAILVVAGLLMAIGLVRGYPFADAALVAITLAVAAIPEGLPAIVTIALAIGVQRMAGRKAIIRRLPAVETLGSTTTICTDKTGTLTRNEMTVQAVWVREHVYRVSGVGYRAQGELYDGDTGLDEVPKAVRRLVSLAVLCSDASVHQNGDAPPEVHGDPTEVALIVLAQKLGLNVDEVRKACPRLDVVPFESEHQLMATLLSESSEAALMAVKGAPEAVFRRCKGTLDDARSQVEAMAQQGMRVLAIAVGPSKPNEGRALCLADVDGDLELLGMVGMIDPPRAEAIDAIAACVEAGIVVKMITGDHQTTAQAIGRKLGIVGAEQSIDGATLSTLSEEELRGVVKDIHIFARVAPENKLAIVRALQSHGEVVAMTGDGVNDAPALKQANIGVAMGMSGTSAAREAADMVLADDNFGTIVAAVEEGRRVYDNLIKSLAFVLPTNIGLALILMVSVCFFPLQEIAGERFPLSPMHPSQILWINLIAAVALALPLAFEAKEPGVMGRKPRDPGAPVMSRMVVRRTVVASMLMAGVALGVFLWQYQRELPLMGHRSAVREAQSMVVTTVIAFQCFYLLTCRSLQAGLRSIGLLSNWTIFVGIGTVVGLHLLFLYWKAMQALFDSIALDGTAVVTSVLVGAIIVPVMLVEKRLRLV